MKLKAIRKQELIYEVQRKYYPEGSTNEEIIEIDLKAMLEDPDLFFMGDDVKDFMEIQEVYDEV